MKILPLEKKNEARFLSFLAKDETRHVFTIYDLKYDRDKTHVWVATKDGEINGYLFEFDKRIVHTHGASESIEKLLQHIELKEPTLIIEPHHLTIVKKAFDPVEPTDAASQGKITTYLVMKTDAKNFKPIIRHQTKKLETEHLNEVLEIFGEEWTNRVKSAIERGMAYGAYEKNTLASTTTTTEILNKIAFIRGVLTIPSLRGKGLATSAVSALVKEIISLHKEAVLWVAEDNLPARHVYEKIGFKRTEHVLLGFKARKL